MGSSHDHYILSTAQNFKNLILDYPHQALAFFAAEEAANQVSDAEVTPVRQELKTGSAIVSGSSMSR